MTRTRRLIWKKVINPIRRLANVTIDQPSIIKALAIQQAIYGRLPCGADQESRLDLAIAVAASSAFPPFLSPVVLKLNSADFDPSTKGDLQIEPYTSQVVLTDGGVYDNLGLENSLERLRNHSR
jgi:hypothetical protein